MGEKLCPKSDRLAERKVVKEQRSTFELQFYDH